MMYRLTQLCFTCALFVLQFNPQGAIAQEVASTFPQNLQLYPRDVTTNEAIVPIRGTVDPGIYTQINIEVFREEEFWFNVTQPISDVQSDYDYNVTIQAELAEYDFYLYGILHNGGIIVLQTAERVVAGDAYLVSGQSNAMATGIGGGEQQWVNEHPYMRTFSTPNPDYLLEENIYWEEAQSRGTDTFTAVGIWAGRMCRQVIATQAVPCAVINGAFPGVSSTYFARNDNQPLDLETNYGRTLWRAQTAGLANKFRAIFWYQGEDDAWQPQLHQEQMEALRSDWLEDYPNIEHIYLMQIRYGCGITNVVVPVNNDIFEIQRRFKQWDNTSVVSTNGISEFDGCHYFAHGYEKLGNHLYRMIERDLYGAVRNDNIDSPDVLHVTQPTPSEVVVTLDMPPDDSLQYDAGFHVDFTISERGIDFVPFDGVAAGQLITLTLARPASLLDATLSYAGAETDIRFGNNLAFTDWVTNRNGVGVLNFSNVPIKQQLTTPTGNINPPIDISNPNEDDTVEPIPLAISQREMRGVRPFDWTIQLTAIMTLLTVVHLSSKRN